MKTKNKFWSHTIKILALTITVIFAYIIFINPSPSVDSNLLKVCAIDVGQGDSTLIITPSGKAMLIDGGNPDQSSKVISFIKDMGIKKIDILVGTHPDTDHIGSLAQIIREFPVDFLYIPDKTSVAPSYDDMISSAKENHVSIIRALEGNTIHLSSDTESMFLSPFDHSYENTNLASAVIYIKHGQNSFLFMGDSEIQNEREILKKYNNLKAVFLKVGHHGSKGSSSDEFVNVVNPKIALISCGYKNPYSHPHKKVMQLLQKKNITVYRTDEQSDIIFYSDGKQIFTDTKSPGSYKYYEY